MKDLIKCLKDADKNKKTVLYKQDDENDSTKDIYYTGKISNILIKSMTNNFYTIEFDLGGERIILFAKNNSVQHVPNLNVDKFYILDKKGQAYISITIS